MIDRRALLPLAVLIGCAGPSLLDRIEHASASAGSVTVRMPWALQPFKDAPAPVYFRIINHGTNADTLDGVASPVAGMAMLHGTSAAGSMTPLAELAIPPGDSVVLRPGVLHVMLDSLHRNLLRGDSLMLTLHFRRGGGLTLAVPVIGYGDLDRYAAKLEGRP